MTTAKDVEVVLKQVTDERFVQAAEAWLKDDEVLEKIAIGHDAFVADAGENFEIEGFVYSQLERSWFIKEGIV